MARITRFTKDTGTGAGEHPTEVECAYSIASFGGKRYLQLNTFGSRTRKIPGKVSQTLQLDERAVRELVAILREAFPQAVTGGGGGVTRESFGKNS